MGPISGSCGADPGAPFSNLRLHFTSCSSRNRAVHVSVSSSPTPGWPHLYVHQFSEEPQARRRLQGPQGPASQAGGPAAWQSGGFRWQRPARWAPQAEPDSPRPGLAVPGLPPCNVRVTVAGGSHRLRGLSHSTLPPASSEIPGERLPSLSLSELLCKLDDSVPCAVGDWHITEGFIVTAP